MRIKLLTITVSEIKSRRNLIHYLFNFSNTKSLLEFIKNVPADYPKIDILVNNAGTIFRKPIAEHLDENWNKIKEVNLSA